MIAPERTLKVSLPSDTDILFERDFGSTRDLVWRALTEPELVRQWWGPHGTSLRSCDIDLRPGGAWRFVIVTADGEEIPFKGEYREIVAPERIVQTWVCDVPPIDQYVAVETMTLLERDGGTLLRTLAHHPSREARDGHLQSGMERGATQTMDRLEALLPTIR